MNEKGTVLDVIEDNLCMGCGTCISFCKKKALKLIINKEKGIYIPQLDKKECDNCKVCLKVCPGHEVDFKELNKEIFGKQPHNVLIGNHINCYIGHSNEKDIRYNASSGGVVTQLLISLLEEEIIDGALITKMKKNSPLEPQPFIARTKEDIMEAMGSKYCPVPLNIALKDILESNDKEKFAVVGLPCHIHGIRKAGQLSKKIKEKIILQLGIICSKCPNFTGTDYILWKNGISQEDIMDISYRGRGYPGGMEIKLKNGEKVFFNFWDYYDTSFGQFFPPLRCRLCVDYTCELSDLSIGDMFSKEIVLKDHFGTSVIITRNKKAENFLNSVKNLVIIPKKIEEVVKVSGPNLIFKKTDLKVKTLFLNHQPKYNTVYLGTFNALIYSTLFMIIYLLGSFFASKRRLWKIMIVYASFIKLFENFFSRN